METIWFWSSKSWIVLKGLCRTKQNVKLMAVPLSYEICIRKIKHLVQYPESNREIHLKFYQIWNTSENHELSSISIAYFTNKNCISPIPNKLTIINHWRAWFQATTFWSAQLHILNFITDKQKHMEWGGDKNQRISSNQNALTTSHPKRWRTDGLPFCQWGVFTHVETNPAVLVASPTQGAYLQEPPPQWSEGTKNVVWTWWHSSMLIENCPPLKSLAEKQPSSATSLHLE